MRAPRLALLSIPVAALTLIGAQLGASAAAAATAEPVVDSTGVIALQLPASPYPTQGPPVPPAVLTIGQAFSFGASVPSPSGSTAATTGTLLIEVGALSALPAADLMVTATTNGTEQTVALSNDAADGGDVTDAAGSVAISLPASGPQTTTFSVTATSAAGVRGQLELYVEFDSDATDSSGNPVYEADDYAALAAGDDFAQVPRSTPERVAENVALFRPSARSLYYAKSDTAGGGGAVQAISGRPGDTLLTGDVFGSGDSYLVDYRPSTSTFYFADGFEDVTGGAVNATDYQAVEFGRPGDIPLVGAFPDADNAEGSLDTIAVYRPSNETFYVYGGAVGGLHFGSKGDKPLVGNWTGTKDSEKDAGGDSIGVFRPSNHTFYLLTLSGSTITKVFGRSTDTPVVGEWNGNGETLVGVRRGTQFYLATSNSGSGSTYAPFVFGSGSDVPLAAYVNTPTDLLNVAAVGSENSAVIAKATAGRAAVRAHAVYPRQVRALAIR